MNKNNIVELILNVSIALLGIWIFLKPDVGLDFFRFYLGFILILGAFSLFYFYRINYPRQFKTLAQSVVILILGIFFLISSGFTNATLSLILIVWMLFEAIINLNLAFTYFKFKIKAWIFVLFFALASLGGAYYISQNLQASAMVIVKIAAIFTAARSIVILIDLILYRPKTEKKQIETIE